MKNLNYNPDVLTCLANLSNDEVFTPPSLVNEMLDKLPHEIWSDKNSKFLDPAVKTGVFLREITKRLMEGLKTQIPNEQERRNHILKNQVFGIAITELTALLSRRSLYCSKSASGKYSICDSFDDETGNIIFRNAKHTWSHGTCKYCGANKNVYERAESLESHAYQFIHNFNEIKEVSNMKFDVIIGNPPYQLNTGGTQSQATPIYHHFVQQAKKLNPRYLTMIIPSRWFAGGMGLDKFRESMLSDRRVRKMVDFTNAKDCFPGISLSGGVNYFLWDRDHLGDCEFTSVTKEDTKTLVRRLDEFEVFVRYNEAVDIVHKVLSKKENSLRDIVSSLSPFGIKSDARGENKSVAGYLRLHSSKGVGYLDPKEITQGENLIPKYKVMISKVTSEHAGEPDKSGQFKLLSTVKLLGPDEVCTFSYFIVGCFDSQEQASNLEKYIKTKFVRFLILQAVSSINLSKDKFVFVPIQDFSVEWTDEMLYKKYALEKHESDFIEKLMRPMNSEK